MVVFVAGATGATGQEFVPIAADAGLELRLHVRPRTAAQSPLAADPRARVFELEDAHALEGALAGCDAVVSLVGTMRSRFASGDTYETADVGTTRQLVAAARAAGVGRFVLLSSVGAGGAGAYLRMKGTCEALVRESGLAWTVVRPSALESARAASPGHHGKRWVPLGATAVTASLRRLPGVGGWIAAYGPIPIRVVAAAMVRTLLAPPVAAGEILQGNALWERGT